MAPATEKSQLKRARPSIGEQAESKKPRRSERLQSQTEASSTHAVKPGPLPSPVTLGDSTTTEETKEVTATPPTSRVYSQRKRSPHSSPQAQGLSSPPSDTQAFSQFVYPPKSLFYEVEDEEAQGVWGYLVSLDNQGEGLLVLKRRGACPPQAGKVGEIVTTHPVRPETYQKQEQEYSARKSRKPHAGGYLIGRHPECDRILNNPVVSNRHCLLFNENKGGGSVAVLEDLSANGTFVNDAFVGRNNRRELDEGDEIAIVDYARYSFRYPHHRKTNRFRQQFAIQEQLGKGHFATVYLCIEKSSGLRYAVKKFEKRTGPSERSKVEGLQQEIAVLMSVSQPALLCLKDTFDENDGVYLVLELAPEGELFNWIVMKQKLTEAEARKVFVQLFHGVKYLHERNIVHRDIKPENILLVDKQLTVKLADFGLAKIIGEESFTTTLCGTPSYVAPEILENSNQRRYTRGVDVWSLGVVLYICLCGFPPFSDELYTAEKPFTLPQQIKMGQFDYPSPYWDSVGDPALDLIDRMLTVDVEKRITIDECLEHPWTTGREITLQDSTDGLTGAMSGLDFSKRKMHRERTLLSSLNDVRVSKVIPVQGDVPPVKVFEKNPGSQLQFSQLSDFDVGVVNGGEVEGESKVKAGKKNEMGPSENRNPKEFMAMGGRGDEALFADDESSRYVPETNLQARNGEE